MMIRSLRNCVCVVVVWIDYDGASSHGNTTERARPIFASINTGRLFQATDIRRRCYEGIEDDELGFRVHREAASTRRVFVPQRTGVDVVCEQEARIRVEPLIDLTA